MTDIMASRIVTFLLQFRAYHYCRANTKRYPRPMPVARVTVCASRSSRPWPVPTRS